LWRLPEAWAPYCVFSEPVPGELLGLGPGLLWVASAVIGMGLKWAVGVAQHLHRNVLAWGSRLSAQLPVSCYNSREVGAALGRTVLDVAMFDGANLDPDTCPTFSQAKAKGCMLPSGLQYFHTARPGRGSAPGEGRDLVTEGTAPDGSVRFCCVHVDKFDTSLMCSLGHTTCFPCVASEVQPHPICSAHCNGFKFKCAECGTWSCVSKTQELAMLCGRHSIALDRLRKQRIMRDDFERPRICTCRDTSSDPDTPSSEEEESSSADDHDAAAADGALLPRVCRIDWSHGHAQRAKRLERLRASLLGCSRVVRG